MTVFIFLPELLSERNETGQGIELLCKKGDFIMSGKETSCEKIMFNFDSLRKVIRLKFGSVRQFATEIGLDYNTLQSRLSGKTYFKVSELIACIEVLGLSDKEANCLLFNLSSGPFIAK